MPVMNGFEATVNIRGLSRADAKTIPIIAMTADAFTDALNKAMEIGMTDKVTKPIEPQILYKVLYKNMAEKITDRNREN